MDSRKGKSKVQMDAEATIKDTAAGKGVTHQERKSKKRVPATKKKLDEPIVRKMMDSTVKVTRRPAPEYKLTSPVFEEDRSEFNGMWMQTWGDLIKSMDEKTTIRSVRYADVDSPEVPAGPIDTLQFFEVKISEISGLKWPLQVYGFVAARDMVDYKRNMIFERERDNCQIISEGFPYLALTGPARAVVLVDPVYFEVDLRVKGTGQSEDQELIFVASSFRNIHPLDSSIFKCVYTSNISTLELTFGHIMRSVEASVSMKVINGSWPDGFRGSFAARTASINDMPIGLVYIGDNFKLPLADDGEVKLHRHVVCAEIKDGEHLEVSVSASGLDGQLLEDGLYFTPQQRGKLKGTLNVSSCEIEVTVTWSLIRWC
ncbi:uncharacterized protein LOC124700840 [Lolium rigidum]|uniref:uncharacterized protein LOC124700840 n=1 Tax=Lolium rigidum TaxID=89674 RepID=UPI001F5D7C52|nr:uncharacterized protein LOC124700840 [Lolium rigidum]